MPPLNRDNAIRTGAALATLFDGLATVKWPWPKTISAARKKFNAKNSASQRAYLDRKANRSENKSAATSCQTTQSVV